MATLAKLKFAEARGVNDDATARRKYLEGLGELGFFEYLLHVAEKKAEGKTTSIGVAEIDSRLRQSIEDAAEESLLRLRARRKAAAGLRSTEAQPSVDANSTRGSASGRMAKFCGECGTPFSANSKFCGECGAKRMALA